MRKTNAKKEKFKKYSSKGITLIALVITIIVLLILAGVSIGMITGENGLLTKASEAKEKTEIADAKERAQIDILDWQADQVKNNNDITLDDETVKGILNGKDYISGFNEEDPNNIKVITKNGYEFPISDLYFENENKTPTILTDIYVALYEDNSNVTVVFNNNTDFDTTNLVKIYSDEEGNPLNIKDTHYSLEDINTIPPWISDNLNPDKGEIKITKVDIKAKIAPKETAAWFAICNNLITIENMDNLDTSNVTDMSAMFEGCSNLTELNISGLDIRNVKDMSAMFNGCSNLTELNISGLDTSNVTDMSAMFQGCSNLAKLNIRGLDTSNVTNMSGMFSRCSNLTELNISSLDTSNVTDMSGMFQSCDKLLPNINFLKLNTSNVKNMSNMFSNCYEIETLNLAGLNTSNVTDMSSMFSNCYNLTELDISSFDTRKVANMTSMFQNSSRLEKIYVKQNMWDISKADTTNMFLACGTKEVTYLN